MTRRLTVSLLLLGNLAACSTDKDNTEPPAPLTSIGESIPLELDWKTDTRASANAAAYRLRPLVVGDHVYSIDTNGVVSRVDAASGRRLWRFETGLAAIAGPGGNGELIVVTSRDGEVAAYRPVAGGLEAVWQTRVSSEVRAAPVVDRDQVLVRSVDGHLHSLSAVDGTERWMVAHRVPALSLTGNSQPLVEGELVFSGFDDGKLLAVDRASGQTVWESTISLPRGRTEVERLVDVDGNFVIRDGVIYVATFQGRLAAVQAVSGDLLWSRPFSSYQAIAIDDQAIYLSADDSDIWAIDRRTGAAFWKQDVLHARRITAPAIVGERLVVADYEGYLHWFDKASGSLVGRIRPGDARSFVQPLVWRDRVLSLDMFGLLASVSMPR